MHSHPQLQPASHWRPQSPVFSEWGLEGASRQLAQGLCWKNKPCRKKKITIKREEKCAVIFKKPISYCRFISALKGLMFTWCTALICPWTKAPLVGRPWGGGLGISLPVIHSSPSAHVPSWWYHGLCWAQGCNVQPSSCPNRALRQGWEGGHQFWIKASFLKEEAFFRLALMGG